MTPTQIVLLVLGILTFQALVWIPIVLWVRRRTAAVIEALSRELAAAPAGVVIPPEPALYRGASARFGRVKSAGALALTQTHLQFRSLTGKDLVIARAEAVGLREHRWFLGAYRNGRLHTILKLTDGVEVGFQARDPAAWRVALSLPPY